MILEAIVLGLWAVTGRVICHPTTNSSGAILVLAITVGVSVLALIFGG